MVSSSIRLQLEFSPSSQGDRLSPDAPLFVYSDETEFFVDGSRRVGTAFLVTDQVIEEGIVKDALLELARDPDNSMPSRKSKDDLTLSRGYFHASEDSANAHSHLARAIASRIRGLITYACYAPSSGVTRRQEILQNETLVLTALTTFSDHRGQIRLVVEDRAGMSTLLAKWPDSLYSILEEVLIESPSGPMAFPDISVCVDKKHSPGLQVVDFLLWAINREQMGKPQWAQRLGLALDHTGTIPMQEGIEIAIHTGDYHCARRLRREEISYPELNAAKIEAHGWQAVWCAFSTIENVVRKALVLGVPSHAEHLLQEVRELERLDWKPSSGIGEDEVIRRLCRSYVRLFDTVPTYPQLTTPFTWEVSLRFAARNLALLLLDRRSARGMRCLATLCGMRRHARMSAG